MFCILKKKTYPAYVSKHNSKREKQVILLMLPNGEGRERSETLATQAKSEGRKAKSKGCKAKSKGRKAKSEGQRRWHYLAVKKLSALLRRITPKHHGDFYCLNCLHSFATTTKNLNRIKKYAKIKISVM